MLSRFGPPAAVVGVARMVFRPGLSATTRVRVSQSVHAGVLPNARSWATRTPLTVMSMGRLTVVALAYQRFRVTGTRRGAARIVHSTYPPVVFWQLTYP